jgi:prophage DNA circulation protein
LSDTYQATLTYTDEYGNEAAFNHDSIQAIDDAFENSIAAYEFPYRDGAALDNMGQKARRIRIRCFFLNEDYDNHKSLINYLSSAGDPAYELVHPKYGLIKGQIESVNIRHDDGERCAEIDLSFIEQMRGIIDPKYRTSVDSGCEEAFLNGQDELTDEIEADIRSEFGAEAATLLDATIDTAKTLFSHFSGLSKTARDWVRAADTYVNTLNRTLTAIENPANSLIGTFSYVTSLPGAIIAPLTRCAERYALLVKEVETSPYQMFSTLRAYMEGLEDATGATFVKYTRIAAAQREALELSSVLADDNVIAQEQERRSKEKSFSTTGVYLKSASEDLPLTVNEIERALADVNEDIQRAVTTARSMRTLKEMAQTLVSHVIDIKIERDRLIKVDIDNELPLHLVCLKYNLPYNYAEKILLVNRIKHPNFVQGEIAIYAR